MNDKINNNGVKVLSKRIIKSPKQVKKELTSKDPHTNAVATVHTIDVALLKVTEQTPAPTATDVKSFRLAPTRVIVRIPVVEHPRTWRSELDESPQETVLTNGMSEQKTPRLGAAEAHVSDSSHGVLVEMSQVASLEEPLPRMASVCEEGCGLMMLRERAEDSMLKA